jgi:hypothetical protein
VPVGVSDLAGEPLYPSASRDESEHTQLSNKTQYHGCEHRCRSFPTSSRSWGSKVLIAAKKGLDADSSLDARVGKLAAGSFHADENSFSTSLRLWNSAPQPEIAGGGELRGDLLALKS